MMGVHPMRSHNNGSLYHPLPENFRFPKAGIYDLWLKWNIPDSERKIPPLRELTSADYCFLDHIPKTDAEKRGSKGRFKDSRRPTRKTFCDIKFVCLHIETIANEEGMDINDRGHTNTKLMYEKVAPVLYECVATSQRSTQLRWLTLVSKLRAKLLKEKKAAAAAANT